MIELSNSQEVMLNFLKERNRPLPEISIYVALGWSSWQDNAIDNLSFDLYELVKKGYVLRMTGHDGVWRYTVEYLPSRDVE